MLVTLGEKGVKTLEDFAGLVGDDIRGYFETKNGERVREPGVLETTSSRRTSRRSSC
jgi:N utilization substance protein A